MLPPFPEGICVDWYQALDPEYVLPDLIKDKIVIFRIYGR